VSLPICIAAAGTYPNPPSNGRSSCRNGPHSFSLPRERVRSSTHPSHSHSTVKSTAVDPKATLTKPRARGVIPRSKATFDRKGRSLLLTEVYGSADRNPANTPLSLGMQRRVRRSRHLHPACHRRDYRRRSIPGGGAVRLRDLPDRHGAVLRAAAASAAHESHLGRHPDRRPATGRGCRRRDNDRRRAAGPRDHRLDRTPGAHRLRDRARKASGRPMSVSLPIANHTDWASRRSRKVGREFHPTSLTKM